MERSGTVFCMRPAKNRFALRKTASLYFRTPEPRIKKPLLPVFARRNPAEKKRSAKIEWSEAERFFACALRKTASLYFRTPEPRTKKPLLSARMRKTASLYFRTPESQ
ncbi:hypothetical protein [Desulfonema magnum]|uniref:Uncharacterized protein n=1 Tax=Desulfonema magnum TaxID=45655 RepID=A0A975BTK0_9BACT|nr:hypothetical protein [Desulfonema magnum]QTA90984.1 Uncharacterized protein dnm_070480 [Desulfonema magnum]